MGVVIREARAEEFGPLGQLMVAVYGAIEGFPTAVGQPRYYEMLANIGAFAARPDTTLLVAIAGERLVGGVVYFSEMANYGADVASREPNASAFRLLAVAPDARGLGVGKALVTSCLDRAKQAGRSQVIIHSTDAQKVARAMYAQLGFQRAPELDFMQEALQVMGFRRAC